jgi:hypothetical protein
MNLDSSEARNNTVSAAQGGEDVISGLYRRDEMVDCLT